METFVIVAYCASDDVRKILKIKDNIQTNVGIAQIVTTVLVAARYFGGNHNLSQDFLYEHRYFHYRLSPSQFNRRLHSVPPSFFNELAALFSHYAKMTNESFEFTIDSFPVPVCDNIRIQRSKLFSQKLHRGFIASKKRYFYGLRIHMLASIGRLPVEFEILPAHVSDIEGAKKLAFKLPQGSIVYGDKAYNDYEMEDGLKKFKRIELAAIRKKNSLRSRDPQEEFCMRRKRKSIETMFSSIAKLIPKKIHAVTEKGFLLKTFCFVLAYSASFFQVTT